MRKQTKASDDWSGPNSLNNIPIQTANYHHLFIFNSELCIVLLFMSVANILPRIACSFIVHSIGDGWREHKLHTINSSITFLHSLCALIKMLLPNQRFHSSVNRIPNKCTRNTYICWDDASYSSRFSQQVATESKFLINISFIELHLSDDVRVDGDVRQCHQIALPISNTDTMCGAWRKKNWFGNFLIAIYGIFDKMKHKNPSYTNVCSLI